MGLSALCSVGPILTVLILSLIYQPESAAFSAQLVPDVSESVEMGRLFAAGFPSYIKEIARALRLRNLSGIIIVDFINCKDDEQKHALLKKLRDLVKEDIVPTKVIDMTPLGLVEITRKKVLKPLREQYFKEKSI